MNIRGAYPSKYLKKEDLFEMPGRAINVAISHVQMEDPDGKGKEMKPVIYFQGWKKGLVSGVVVGLAVGELLGDDETSTWIGRVVNLYVDPEVMYGPNKVGGLRIRAAAQPAPAQPVAAQPVAAQPVDPAAPAQTHAHNLHQAINELPPASATVATPAAVPTQAAPAQGVQAPVGPDPNEPIPDDDLPF